MKPTRNVALDCAMVCLALGAVAMIAASPARAEGASDSAPNIAPVLKCGDLTGWKIPGSTAVVSKAQEVPEAPPGTVQPSPSSPATVSVALPPNCRADGVIDQRVGVDGKSYAIGFAVALPDRWNGRFLYQGGGGLNGSIRPPLGSQAAGEVPAPNTRCRPASTSSDT
jgi:feruloyl esterase